MIDIKDTIKVTGNKFRDKLSITKIILFGSYAHGAPDKDSDIDLCVLTDIKNRRKIEIMRDIRRELACNLSQAFDILVYDEKDFNERAAIKNTFEYEIINRGVLIIG
ncbi:MAG: nucleotidyltransferase domain-containing protein [Candidatus Latescibacteria bacterium]|nr:nucleotidyltransferase domain-containing protein [Candidatus Latescibacterota bacterium]